MSEFLYVEDTWENREMTPEEREVMHQVLRDAEISLGLDPDHLEESLQNLDYGDDDE